MEKSGAPLSQVQPLSVRPVQNPRDTELFALSKRFCDHPRNGKFLRRRKNSRRAIWSDAKRKRSGARMRFAGRVGASDAVKMVRNAGNVTCGHTTQHVAGLLRLYIVAACQALLRMRPKANAASWCSRRSTSIDARHGAGDGRPDGGRAVRSTTPERACGLPGRSPGGAHYPPPPCQPRRRS